MKRLVIFLFLFFSFVSHSQFTNIKEQKYDASWDQGIPFCPEDEYIDNLTKQLSYDSLLLTNKHTDENSVKLCREIGIAFYNKGMYDAADWYLSRVKDYEESIEIDVIQRKKMIDEIRDKKQEVDFSESQIESLKKDAKILEGLPDSYDNLSVNDLRDVVKKIDGQIKKLTHERDSLSKHEGNEEVVKLKDGTINTLEKEKEVINLTIDKTELKEDKKILGLEKEKLKTYLIWLGVITAVLVLVLLVLSQRKTIRVQDDEIESQLKDINKKNTYLEHAARFIRHDMHSGINTYIPRGISSLEKRLSVEDIKNLKIESPLKMIREGLSHTQKVYKNVYEFTNLVKQNSVLDKKNVNLTNLLNDYIKTTSYTSQVEIGELVDSEVNEILFCNAIDNLIKNGLQYNNSQPKVVKVFMENGNLVLQDNGVGMTQEQFDKICKTYNKKTNKDIDKDTYGLGLNICLAILNEHGFDLSCEKNDVGTKMIIKFN